MNVYLIILYVFLGLLFLSSLPWFQNKRSAKKKFFKALNSVINQTESLSEQIEQIDIHFKKLSENNRYVSRELRSAEDLIEDFIFVLDTNDKSDLLLSGMSGDQLKARTKAIALLNELRRIRPFISLPSREANLLASVDQAISENNGNLSKQLIRQLAQEIGKSDSLLRTQERKNRVSFIISAAGIILTTVFGAVSLIQYFVK